MEPVTGSHGPHTDPVAPPGIDVTTPHPARRYDYWLGGKDNFEADRASAEAVAEAFPSVQISALENRAFLHRVVGYLSAEVGIRQFLDLGAGLPTAGNVHEIAQAAAPESRIVYVDTWPLPEGMANNDELPVVDGAVPLPDWSIFDDADVRDLDEGLRARMRADAVPEPAGTARDGQQLRDERRRGIPTTLIATSRTEAEYR